MKPLVALVGRPNVGKSTLFNRMVGRRLALVADEPGVTRDRHYADTSWAGREFTVVDTGGFAPTEPDELSTGVRAQAEVAIATSDVVLLLVDGRFGPVAADTELASLLRRSGKPVLVVVNKLDHPPAAQTGVAEFYQLGFRDVLPISAEHSLGLDALLDSTLQKLPPTVAERVRAAEPGEGPVRVAIVGRPNVGKSTLVNSLLGEPRVICGPFPGTTRDPINTEVLFKNRRIVLTDTAGIRRKHSIAGRVERLSILGALRSIERSDVVALVLDATEAGVEQDIRLAGMVEEKGRGLVLFINKWDLVDHSARAEGALRSDLQWQFRFVDYAPVVFGSALQRSHVTAVLDVAVELFDEAHRRASTPMLNRLLQKVTEAQPASSDRGHPLRFYYVSQVAVGPPTFALTCNRPRSVTKSYRRYLTNQLRKALSLRVPVKLLFRERPGHSAAAKTRKKRVGHH